MFDPSSTNKAAKSAKALKKKQEAEIKKICLTLVPIHLLEGIMIDVKEVICGDPQCAPIDTVITILWSPPGKGVFALPYSVNELGPEDLMDMFPDETTLTKWKSGIKAPWPPRPPMPVLRFAVGDRVECRIGPHPVKGWALGRVAKRFYREPSWPPDMMAPYQVALHDGRLIFAPQDTDTVIRSRPMPADDAPSSPDHSHYFNYNEDEFDDEEKVEENDHFEIEDGNVNNNGINNLSLNSGGSASSSSSNNNNNNNNNNNEGKRRDISTPVSTGN
jgi:hypothetical protein